MWRRGGAPGGQGIGDSCEGRVGLGGREGKLQLYSGHGVLTGHYRRSIFGDVLSSRHGIVHDSKVVYGPWLELGGGRFKGYAMFRNARQKLERVKGDLVKRQVAKAVRRLGG